MQAWSRGSINKFQHSGKHAQLPDVPDRMAILCCSCRRWSKINAQFLHSMQDGRASPALVVVFLASCLIPARCRYRAVSSHISSPIYGNCHKSLHWQTPVRVRTAHVRKTRRTHFDREWRSPLHAISLANGPDVEPDLLRSKRPGAHNTRKDAIYKTNLWAIPWYAFIASMLACLDHQVSDGAIDRYIDRYLPSGAGLDVTLHHNQHDNHEQCSHDNPSIQRQIAPEIIGYPTP